MSAAQIMQRAVAETQKICQEYALRSNRVMLYSKHAAGRHTRLRYAATGDENQVHHDAGHAHHTTRATRRLQPAYASSFYAKYC